jgi:RimJ/RimL family protein N-acetyltransferase
MEKMPYQQQVTMPAVRTTTAVADVVSTDWKKALPVLRGQVVTLRQLRASDAQSLFAMLTAEEVSRFISPPPTTVEGFEKFIAWTLRMREVGSYACFAVTLEGSDTAVGIFQLRELEPGFGTAEWGFAIGSAFWGCGAFTDGAELLIKFAFETVGVHRLEARASVKNGRGNGALRKIGAVQEGVLRRSFLKNGEYHDQVLWSIIDEDWYGAEAAVTPGTSIH